MSIVSHALSLSANFLLWLYKHLGINGILTVILLIEIPIIIFACYDIQDDYQIEKNYHLSVKSDLTKAEYAEFAKYVNPCTFDDNVLCYKLSIYLDNRYYTQLSYPSLSAKNQEGNFIDIDRVNYYDDIEDYDVIRSQEVIPPGASVVTSYVLSIEDDIADQTSSIVISPLIGDKKLIKENEITIILP